MIGDLQAVGSSPYRGIEMLGNVYQSLMSLSSSAIEPSLLPSTELSSMSSALSSVGMSAEDGEDRPFPCPYCEARFKKKQHLQNHARIHTGEKYVCNVCQQGFSRQSILKQHMLRKHYEDCVMGLRVGTVQNNETPLLNPFNNGL